MKHKRKLIRIIYLAAVLLFCCATSYCQQKAQRDRQAHTRSASAKAGKKIVLIAGEKSHPPGTHEYIKTVRLIKTMLDNSNVKDISTEVYLHGWPPNEKTLDDADLIFFVADGRDGGPFPDVPFMTPERMRVMEKQMNRGCGFALLHFATFATYAHGQKFLEWGGGYYDWEDAAGKTHKYSELKEAEGEVLLASPEHTILNGVQPFRIKDEFYYNIRFREQDPRLTPVLEVPALGGRPGTGNVVAWAVERQDGGRGFSATFNHFYTNWQNPDYRKVLLNGLVWAAGAEVPATGVEAKFFTDQEVTEHIYGKSVKALFFTDSDAVENDEGGNTAPIKMALESDQRFLVDMTSNINDLWQYDLNDYKLLVMNQNDVTAINNYSKQALEAYLKEGGGLITIAFEASANPDSSAAAWPAYESIFRREVVVLTTSNENKNHLRINTQPHFITNKVKDFNLIIENNFRLKGEMPVEPLLYAQLRNTEEKLPVAWVYNYGKGRIFQSIPWQNSHFIKIAQFAYLFRNAAIWVSEVN